MILFNPFKKIYDYKVLEKIRIDITAEMAKIPMDNGSFSSDFCYPIAQDNGFYFYVYKACKDGSGGYILKQSKTNAKKVWFFGVSKGNLTCVFNNCLFQISSASRESSRHYLYCTDIDSGNQIAYDWFGKNTIFTAIGGYGRYWCQDTVNKMYVEDNCLLLEINRRKGTAAKEIHNNNALDTTDLYNFDMNYKIIATIQNGHIDLKKEWNI